MNAGRYAPSPTGDLHLGNLRTALLAWAWARKSGREFYLRLEDLDEGRARDPQGQIDDLRKLGIDWDGPIIIQSERKHLYQAAIDRLRAEDRVFECYCSRRDIREAASAAHAPPEHYPGPCADLTEEERVVRRQALAQQGRKPALRLRADVTDWTIFDELHGEFRGPVEQVVLQRGDGAFAYNLASVVDDIEQGVDQVVRGDDLLASAPTQAYLTALLGGTQAVYAHVPLVLGPDNKRLAKRHGAVTLSDLDNIGYTTTDVLRLLTGSIGSREADNSRAFLSTFDTGAVHTRPCAYSGDTQPLLRILEKPA